MSITKLGVVTPPAPDGTKTGSPSKLCPKCSRELVQQGPVTLCPSCGTQYTEAPDNPESW
jgi:hypothetical protein